MACETKFKSVFVRNSLMDVSPSIFPSLSTPERLMAVSFFREECGRQNL